MSAPKKRRGRPWLPWRAFDGLGLEWRAHRGDVAEMSPVEVRHNVLILLIVVLIVLTCAAALALPRLALLIDIVGGLVSAAVVLLLTGQWQELRRGLVETGHWTAVDAQGEKIRQYILVALLRAQEHRRTRREREQAHQEEVQQ